MMRNWASWVFRDSEICLHPTDGARRMNRSRLTRDRKQKLKASRRSSVTVIVPLRLTAPMVFNEVCVRWISDALRGLSVGVLTPMVYRVVLQ